ncbi:MAG: hypothetical protein J6K80_03115, partial [Oscillospiraceae bacterium]|nr:hypothetical protein [Oscillospiraceae bacterium]
SRGKPNSDQLDISLPLLSEARPREKCFSINGVDCRNYGVLDGIPEMKKLFADMLGIKEKYITTQDINYEKNTWYTGRYGPSCNSRPFYKDCNNDKGRLRQ